MGILALARYDVLLLVLPANSCVEKEDEEAKVVERDASLLL
jgi:hypothetical protein